MSRIYYETSIETSEILGSGSQFSSVVTTTDKEGAVNAYRTGGRNYLHRITLNPGKPRIVEWWSEWEKCWRECVKG